MKVYLFLFSILLLSCSEQYRGFDLVQDGMYFKLLSLGEDSISLRNADYHLLEFHFCKNSECEEVELSNKIVVKGHEIWNDLNLNDKVIFLFDKKSHNLHNFISVVDTVDFSYPVIVVCQVKASYVDDRFIGRISDYQELMTYRENDLIETWIEKEKGYVFDSSGIYVKVIKEGIGDSAMIDKEVSISYKAFFADGQMFDNTDNWSDTFRYVIGSPNQVIAGLNAGIQGRREGCEAKIIIPSQLAFGQAGSSTGLVPPFEPLKYEITLIEVNNN